MPVYCSGRRMDFGCFREYIADTNYILMLKRSFLLTSFSILLFLSEVAIGQVGASNILHGIVVDDLKAPVANATIQLRSSNDSSIFKTTLSDKHGAYFIQGIVAGKYYLEITIAGFEKKMGLAVSFEGDSTTREMDTIMLAAASQTLSSVVVRGQPPVIERRLDRTVVNIENSVLSEGSSALEVLQKLPGVQVTSNGSISMGGKQNVNVFIDGKPSNLSDEDLSNLLRGMPSGNIQKIEIMSNPSAKFDAAGSGGIINIVRKKNRKEGLNGSINAGIGQGEYTRYNGALNLSYKNQAYNLYLNQAYFHNKSLLGTGIVSDVINTDNSLDNRQASTTRNVRGTGTYMPALGIDLYLSRRTTLTVNSTGSIQTQYNSTISHLTRLDSHLNSTGTVDFNNKYTDAPYNYTISSHFSHQVDTTGGELSVDLDFSRYYNKPGQQIENLLFDENGNLTRDSLNQVDQTRTLRIYSAKADFSKKLRGHVLLEAGWKSSYVKANSDDRFYDVLGGNYVFDPLESNYFINEENINAAYLNLNKEFTRLTLQAGIRAEHTWNKADQVNNGGEIKQNYVKLFPSLFIDYNLNGGDKLNLKVSRRIDRPAYSLMNPFRRPLSATLYFQGNPTLQPQLSTELEMTYSVKNALFLSVGYSVFQDFIATLPFLDSNMVTTTRIPSNVNGTHFYSVGLGYSKRVFPWWTPNYDFSVYQQTSHGSIKGVSLDNPGVLSCDLDLNNTFTLSNNLTAEVNYKIAGRRRVIGTTYGGYSVLSLGAKRTIMKQKGTITLNFINILQTENETSTYQYAQLYQNWSAHFYTRAFILSFSYRFGKGKLSRVRTAGSSEEQKRTGISN